MEYIIKNNLPEELHDTLERRYGSLDGMITSTARNMFLKVLEFLREKGHVFVVEVNYRSEKRKPLRGRIKVEIDGFYYYIELFADTK